MTLFLALLTQPAMASWSTQTIFNNVYAIRTVGLAVDDSLMTPTWYFTADRYDGVYFRELGYKYKDTSLSSFVQISDDLTNNDDSGYLSSITTGNGESSVWVSAQWWNTAPVAPLVDTENLEVLTVTRSTATSPPAAPSWLTTFRTTPRVAVSLSSMKPTRCSTVASRTTRPPMGACTARTSTPTTGASAALGRTWPMRSEATPPRALRSTARWRSARTVRG